MVNMWRGFLVVGLSMPSKFHDPEVCSLISVFLLHLIRCVTVLMSFEVICYHVVSLCLAIGIIIFDCCVYGIWF